jgi:hypothetical protein
VRQIASTLEIVDVRSKIHPARAFSLQTLWRISKIKEQMIPTKKKQKGKKHCKKSSDDEKQSTFH